MSEFEMKLHNPMSKEDWNKITDVNMEHTKAVTFQTGGGKEVEFVKVVRCKDCKYGTEMSGNIVCHQPKHDKYETDIRSFDWFCADGERRSNA